MRKNARGFTIIELLVVIAIIGILTAISIFSFAKYQANTRDSQRSAKTTVIVEALEKYYDHNGEYPSCSQITQNATIIRTSVLPGIDPLALLTPKSTVGDTNSIKCIDITTTTADVYSYIGDGSATCSSGPIVGSSCLQWTLQYREEGTGNIISIQSRRKTLIATSGAPTLTAATTSSTQINTSWNSVSNAVSYTLQQATNNSFTANLVSNNFSTFASSATGLAQGTTYYFRIAAVAADSSQGNWSTIVSATTTIDNPAAYTMDYGNTSATWNFLNATSNAVCPAGTTPSYDWYGNGAFWISGTQYKSVGWQYSAWNQNITLTVASRCITSAAASGFVWANNSGYGALTWPTVWVGGGPERTMQWSGTCPTYTTSSGYDWRVMANRGGWTAGANYVQYTLYANLGVAWGDGDIRVTLHCNGPWGDAAVGGWYTYGTGCVPTITTSWCTY